jgi:hypothetical protein
VTLQTSAFQRKFSARARRPSICYTDEKRIMDKTKFGLIGLFILFSLEACEKYKQTEEKEIEGKRRPTKYYLVPEPKVVYKASNQKTNQSFSYEHISDNLIRFRFISESKQGFCSDTINGIASEIIMTTSSRGVENMGAMRPWRDAFVALNRDCILYVQQRGSWELRVTSTGCKAKEHEECPLSSVTTMGKNGWKPMPDSLKIDGMPYL